jgi:hypothetical protein
MSGWGARLDPFAGRSHATAIAVSKRDRIAPEVRAAPRNTAVEPVVVKTSAGSPASIEHATSDEVDLSPAELGRLGVQPGSYVLVPETKAPHHTLATAQRLPDLSFFGVVGTISTSALIDYYRLTLNERVDQIDFGLAFQNSGSVVPVELEVLNQDGQLLGEWSSGAGSASIIFAQIGAQSQGTTLYLAVGVGNGAGATASSVGIDYQLWVSRQTESSQLAVAGLESPGTGASTSAPGAIGVLVPVAAYGTASAGGSAQSSAAAQAGTPGGSPVATAFGSPAILTGRPSVEALSRGESDRSAESNLDFRLRRNQNEQNLADSAINQPNASDARTQEGRDADGEALAAINGPGGFALVEAVAIGHRHRGRNPLARPDDLVTNPTTDASLAVVLAEPTSPRDPIIVTAEQSPVDDRSERSGVWHGLPGPMFSTLGVALVFTLNAVLSQPVAGFDYLASRFDGKTGKLTPRPRRNAANR